MFLALDEARPVTARRIALAFRVSETHLVKVLQALHRAGLVRSARGPGGGYRLTRPASNIRLIEVVEAIEGPLEVRDCLLHHRQCRNPRCMLGPLVKTINTQTLNYLRRHTVKDLASNLSQSEPLSITRQI